MPVQHIEDFSAQWLTPMTEEQLADWHRHEGTQVIYHRGHYWRQTPVGFYQPLHWLARLGVEDARCPTLLRWGFRASLQDDDAAFANGSIPIHLLSNVTDYDLSSLKQKRRQNLLKCRKLVQFVQLTSPALLQEQGYEVLLSTLKRTQYITIPTQKEYLANITEYFTFGGWLVLAGLIDTKLGGYLSGCAIDGTAYMGDRMIVTEALPTNISSGLTFEFVQICRQSGKIREIVSGLHTPENPGLSAFKEDMGFPVKHIPALVQINPLVEKFIRWRYPLKYYYLTGHN
ncbi:MAG: hypothetical protein VKL59_09210 [Nostocaceae cyanobacterium]|nr:hypothetical protein [Nostocaceae cyanobacterium]